MNFAPSIRSWFADRASAATLVALAIIILQAGVLRIAPLPQEPLWLDELHTSWTVVAGLADVAPRARLGNQSPLYFYLPWLTTHVLGPSEFTLRLPSLAAGLALVPLVFVAAVYFSGSRIAGLTAALLVAIDQDCIFFAQEARPYALVQVLAVVNAVCFWRMLAAPSFAVRAAWVLTGALLFYTHYTAALILLGEGAYLVGFVATVWLRGLCFPARHAAGAKVALHKLLQVGFDATLLAMLCLPAAPQLSDIFSRRNHWRQFIDAPDVFTLVNSVSFWPLIAIPALVALVAAAIARWRGTKQETSIDFAKPWFLACWCLVPLALVALCEWTNFSPLHHVRYLVGAIPAAMLFAVTVLGTIPSRRAQQLAYAMVLLAVLGFDARLPEAIANGSLPATRCQNWRSAIEYINASGDRGVPVVVDSGLLETPYFANDDDPLKREYCVLPVRGLYSLSRELPVFGADERLPRGFSGLPPRSEGSTIYWLITIRPTEPMWRSDCEWGATHPKRVDVHFGNDYIAWRSTSTDFGEVSVLRIIAAPRQTP